MERVDSLGAALAALLEYPGEDFDRRLDTARHFVGLEVPQAEPAVAEFASGVRPLSPDMREELFTRTFDLNPVCALEIGWQLFGEEYYRGQLLVRLRNELRRHGIEESTELPDHLIHVLPLLDRMDRTEAARFVHACVSPAVAKMRAGFKQVSGTVVRSTVPAVPATVPDTFLNPAENRDNPYEHLLAAIGVVLDVRYGATPPETVNDQCAAIS